MHESPFEQLRDDIKRGDTIAVRRFLQRGGDPNLRNERGECALGVAAFEGQTGVVELLLESGALVDGHCKEGWTPLYCACTNGHVRTAQALLKHGAARDVTMNGKPILYCLSLYGDRARIIELLTAAPSGEPSAT